MTWKGGLLFFAVGLVVGGAIAVWLVRGAADVMALSAWVQAVMAVFVAGFTLALVIYSHRGWQVAKASADAATLSANVARDTLKLAAATYLDLKDLVIEPLKDSAGVPQYVRIAYKVFNPSSNPAKVSRFQATYAIAGCQDQVITRAVQTVITPGKGYEMPLEVGPLTAEQRTLYDQNKLMVTVRIEVAYANPLGENNEAHLNRVVCCGPKPTSILSDLSTVES